MNGERRKKNFTAETPRAPRASIRNQKPSSDICLLTLDWPVTGHIRISAFIGGYNGSDP
jgi:hypothetical protein